MQGWGEGRGGKLGVFRKEGGDSCKQCQGENWKTILKKNSLVIVREVRLTQVEGEGGMEDECPHPPINTSLLVGNGPEGFGCVERMS